jgi:hypothetical protein
MIARRLLSVIALMFCFVTSIPAHAQKTKAVLTTEINTNWPDNVVGAITPAILRSTVIDILSSYFDLNGGTSLSCVAHQWVAGLPTLSSITCTQPAFSDISGQAALIQLPTIGADTVLGSLVGGTPIALTQAQLTSLINQATASLSGAVPSFPNTTTSYLRGDLTWQTLNLAAISGFGTNVPGVLGNPVNSSGGFPQILFGTWTPTLIGTSSGAATYTTQVGSYEAIGQHVTARFTLVTASVASIVGNAVLGGLPVTVGNVANDTGSCVLSRMNGATLDTSYTFIGIVPIINTTTAALFENGSGQTSQQFGAGRFAAATTLVGVCEYHS